jgi:hypothetical protein
MNIEEIRQQAQDETTAPEILKQLSSSDDHLTGKYVAENPNTPIEALKKLVQRFPNEIATNPNLDLLFLEDPEIKLFFYKSIAENFNTLPDILSVLAKDSCSLVRDSVAKHLNTSPDTLSILAKDLYRFVRRSVARNSNTSLNVLSVLAKDLYSFVRLDVARNPNISLDILSVLAKDSCSLVRESVAKHPNTSLDMLSVLAKDSERDIRISVAKHPNTSLDILSVLAKDLDSFVRQSVARNSNTSLNVLSVLAKDLDSFVRLDVARNPNTSLDILEEIIQQARDENTAPEILTKLSYSCNYQIRRQVALNPNTPVETLEKLGIEFPEEITNNPIFNLLLLEEPDSEFIQVSLARSSTTSPEILEKLAEILENSNLYGLSERKEIGIIYGLVGNPKTPIYLLEKLAQRALNLAQSGIYYDSDPSLDEESYYDRVFGENLLCSIVTNPQTPLWLLSNIANYNKLLRSQEIADCLEKNQIINQRKY